MMKKRLLEPGNVCLQIVDVQESLMAKIHQADRVAATVELLIRCGRMLGIPMVANTQYQKGLGPYVPALEALVGDLPRFDKVEFNAVQNSGTEAFLNALPMEVTTVALVGVETHICIYQTALGLLDKGFAVWVVADGVSSRKPADHEYALARLRSMGVAVGPTEMLIYELLGKAGTPTFKEVLPYITSRR